MAVIYRKNKNDGRTYAYESESFWVPELGQPRSKRKYLGVVDEATGEIIPSSGKRGRKPGSKSKAKKTSSDSFNELIDMKDQKIKKLQKEIDSLRKENRQYRNLLQKIHTASSIG